MKTHFTRISQSRDEEDENEEEGTEGEQSENSTVPCKAANYESQKYSEVEQPSSKYQAKGAHNYARSEWIEG